MITEKLKIFKKDYLEESSELSRNYFELSGLEIEKVKKMDCEKLIELIQHEMYILLADKSYSMVPDLRMHKKIKADKYGIYLFTDGSYFKKRQAISFEFSNDSNHKFIGFCGWASGCNRIPFIKGFIKWCDYMSQKNKK